MSASAARPSARVCIWKGRSSRAGKCGAQNPDNILKPDIALFNELNELSGGIVRLITVAPEVEARWTLIREASKVCTVSLGHSTADYDQAMAQL